MTRTFRLLPLTVALALGACASTTEAPPAAVMAPAAPAPGTAPSGASFLDRAHDAGRVLIAGQPAAADFATFRAAGIARVVNLRSDAEMAALGLDEAALAQSHGLAYTRVPVDGSAGFTPAALEAVAREIEAGDGRVLLHCASGTRSGLLYAAYLVRYQGVSPTEAMRSLAPLGLWPLPLERMLGRELVLEFAGAASSFEAERD